MDTGSLVLGDSTNPTKFLRSVSREREVVSSQSANLLGWVWLDVPSVVDGMAIELLVLLIPYPVFGTGYIDIISILRESRESFGCESKPGVFLFYS